MTSVATPTSLPVRGVFVAPRPHRTPVRASVTRRRWHFGPVDAARWPQDAASSRWFLVFWHSLYLSIPAVVRSTTPTSTDQHSALIHTPPLATPPRSIGSSRWVSLSSAFWLPVGVSALSLVLETGSALVPRCCLVRAALCGSCGPATDTNMFDMDETQLRSWELYLNKKKARAAPTAAAGGGRCVHSILPLPPPLATPTPVVPKTCPPSPANVGPPLSSPLFPPP